MGKAMVKKKNVIILTAVLCSVLLGAVLSQNCFSDTTARAESNSLEIAESWFNTDSKSATEQDIQQDLMKRFVYVVSLVVLLGVVAYYVTKKLLPKLTVTQGKNISVIETVPLGPHKLLHLIQISDNRRLLIGSTNENINLLADVTEDFSTSRDSNATDK